MPINFLIIAKDDADFRRNHAYPWWYTVGDFKDLSVAFQVDSPDATVVTNANNAEDEAATRA